MSIEDIEKEKNSEIYGLKDRILGVNYLLFSALFLALALWVDRVGAGNWFYASSALYLGAFMCLLLGATTFMDRGIKKAVPSIIGIIGILSILLFTNNEFNSKEQDNKELSKKLIQVKKSSHVELKRLKDLFQLQRQQLDRQKEKLDNFKEAERNPDNVSYRFNQVTLSDLKRNNHTGQFILRYTDGTLYLKGQLINGAERGIWTNYYHGKVTDKYKYTRTRVGAKCNDGTSSTSTGRGTCSWHNGVQYWKYDYYKKRIN